MFQWRTLTTRRPLKIMKLLKERKESQRKVGVSSAFATSSPRRPFTAPLSSLGSFLWTVHWISVSAIRRCGAHEEAGDPVGEALGAVVAPVGEMERVGEEGQTISSMEATVVDEFK
jgi:hypothetical protein